MNFLSLFSGIDGFDTGLERAGMKCIGKAEQDRWCNAVSRYHSPEVKRISDVKEIKRATFPVPELICAGVPCQDVSIAGKRAGLDGERTGLFFEFARIIKIFKPKWLVFENVPGLLSANERRDFARVLGELGECGYLLAYRILDSQYFGVAQRRRRVFIVGSLGNGRCAEVLFESESLRRNPAEGRKTGERIAPTVSQRSKGRGYGDDGMNGALAISPSVSSKWAKGTGGPSGDECQNLTAYHIHHGQADKKEINPTICVNEGPNRHQGVSNTDFTAITHSLKARTDGSEDGTGRGTPIVTIGFSHRDNGRDAAEEISPTLRCFNPKSKGVNQPVGGMAVAYGKHIKTTGYQGDDVIGDGDVWCSLPAQGGNNSGGPGALLHQLSMGVRRLTPRECERLQGFPDDYTRYGIEAGKKIEISGTQRYRMLGNAITVSVSEWIGKRIQRKLF